MEETLLANKLDASANPCALRCSCVQNLRINQFSAADRNRRSGGVAKAGSSPIQKQYHPINGVVHSDANARPNSGGDNGDAENVKETPKAAAIQHRRGFVSHGSVSLKGCRRNMEDAVATVPGFLPGHGFFAVYDGHGGAEVAEACRDRMHAVLAEQMQKRRNARVGGGAAFAEDAATGGFLRRWWTEAFEASFQAVDAEVWQPRAAGMPGSGNTVGSTATVAVVGTKDIVVANCGDSRAVLCRGGHPVPLSYDHKPDRPDELARIEAAGGRVINWGGPRVLGVLATSRSLGDQYLRPYVTPEPEVTVTPRTDRDEFLIVATDGLWDTVSNEVACAVTRRCLAGLLLPRPTAADGLDDGRSQLAAAVLAELAMARGSRDNVSVVVVELRKITARRTRKGHGPGP